MLMKTDHKGFVLPAGTKLKPLRRKLQLRDCRKHRKQDFYQALASEDWNEVLAAENVNLMEDKIKTLMDKCMPIKYVRMSTRDPIWMTPLVKSLFRAKSRISLNNEERLRLINCRISEVISENRRNPRVMIGSRRWWENVDSISQRRNSSQISLDPDSLDRLNDHFGQTCYDDNYIPPSDMMIAQGVEIPKISEMYVRDILSKLTRNTCMQ
jgi:hypothetical protein